MRLPSIENRARFQEDYRRAVHQLALADETDDDRRKRQAQARVADAVRALRSIGINPIRAWRLEVAADSPRPQWCGTSSPGRVRFPLHVRPERVGQAAQAGRQ